MAGYGLGRQGGVLSGWEHTAQSIQDILTTPKGSRIMRREYGAELYGLIDAPMNSLVITRCFVAIATALEPRLGEDGHQYGEPRFILKRVYTAEAGPAGAIVFDLEGIYVPEGHLRRVSVTLYR